MSQTRSQAALGGLVRGFSLSWVDAKQQSGSGITRDGDRRLREPEAAGRGTDRKSSEAARQSGRLFCVKGANSPAPDQSRGTAEDRGGTEETLGEGAGKQEIPARKRSEGAGGS